jgi:hypothetical protein
MTLQNFRHGSLAGGPIIMQMGWPHHPAKNYVTWPHDPANRHAQCVTNVFRKNARLWTRSERWTGERESWLGRCSLSISRWRPPIESPHAPAGSSRHQEREEKDDQPQRSVESESKTTFVLDRSGCFREAMTPILNRRSISKKLTITRDRVAARSSILSAAGELPCLHPPWPTQSARKKRRGSPRSGGRSGRKCSRWKRRASCTF